VNGVARQWGVRLATLDRRWIYLALAGALVTALLADVRFPDEPSVLSQPIYDAIEALPAGTPVLLSLDYSPGSAPELEPMAFALARHALHLGHRLILISLWDTGNIMIARLVERAICPDFPQREEGRDWVVLGYKAGNEMLLTAIRHDIAAMYVADRRGRPLSELPVFDGVKGLADCGLVLSLSAGYPGLKEWILFVGDPTRVPVAGGSTGVGTPEFLAYFPRQLQGLLAGLKGASEYEAALGRGHPEFLQRTQAATDGMGPQAVGHLVIILFLLLGNIGVLMARRQRGGRANSPTPGAVRADAGAPPAETRDP
jgi:hypothetical protein